MCGAMSGGPSNFPSFHTSSTARRAMATGSGLDWARDGALDAIRNAVTPTVRTDSLRGRIVCLNPLYAPGLPADVRDTISLARPRSSGQYTHRPIHLLRGGRM